MQNTHTTWDKHSPITAMDTVPAKDRKDQHVYLYANAQLEPGALSPLIATLKMKGYNDVYPDVKDGKNCLVVRHVKDTKPILDLLEKEKQAIGTTQTKHDDSASEEKEGFSSSWIRKEAVRGSAISSAGSMALRAGSAWIRKDTSFITGASIGILANAILLFYGTGEGADAGKLLEQSRKYLETQGIDLPELEEPKKQSLIKSIETFIAKRPVETAYALTLPASAAYVHSGIKTQNPWLTMRGSLNVVGNGAVVFVPETRKTPDQQEKPVLKEFSDGLLHAPQAFGYALQHPQNVPLDVWHFVQSSPKRFSALVNLLPGNILGLLDAWHQTQNVNVHWKEQNPSKIKTLQEQITAFEQTGNSATQAGKTYLEGLTKNLETLERQVEIAHGSGGKAIPYLMLGGCLLGILNMAFVSIGTKNRFSQQMDMTNFDKLYSYAAQTLLALPKEQRENVFEHMTGFLTNQPDVQDGFITLDTLKKEIHTRMDAMEKSPFIEPIGALREKEIGMGR